MNPQALLAAFLMVVFTAPSLGFPQTVGQVSPDPNQDQEYQKYLREKQEQKNKAAKEAWLELFRTSPYDVDAIQKAIAGGADVNTQTDISTTLTNGSSRGPLLLKVVTSTSWYKNASDVVTLLIKAGAEVNPKLANGGTLLFEAIYARAPEPVVRQLLAFSGAKKVINTRNPVLKSNVFQVALSHGDLEVIRDLVAAGAEPVVDGKPIEVLRYLPTGSKALPELLQFAIDFAGIDQLKAEMNQTVDKKSGGSSVLLNGVVKAGQSGLALFYVEQLGANPALKDDDGVSAYDIVNAMLDRCMGYSACAQVKGFQSDLQKAAGYKVDPANPRGYTCVKFIDCGLHTGPGDPHCTTDYIEWSKTGCSVPPMIVS